MPSGQERVLKLRKSVRISIRHDMSMIDHNPDMIGKCDSLKSKDVGKSIHHGLLHQLQRLISRKSREVWRRARLDWWWAAQRIGTGFYYGNYLKWAVICAYKFLVCLVGVVSAMMRHNSTIRQRNVINEGTAEFFMARFRHFETILKICMMLKVLNHRSNPMELLIIKVLTNYSGRRHGQ